MFTAIVIQLTSKAAVRHIPPRLAYKEVFEFLLNLMVGLPKPTSVNSYNQKMTHQTIALMVNLSATSIWALAQVKGMLSFQTAQPFQVLIIWQTPMVSMPTIALSAPVPMLVNIITIPAFRLCPLQAVSWIWKRRASSASPQPLFVCMLDLCRESAHQI